MRCTYFEFIGGKYDLKNGERSKEVKCGKEDCENEDHLCACEDPDGECDETDRVTHGYHYLK